MDVSEQAPIVPLERATHMNPIALRNGLISALCFYGVLGWITDLIWG